jgi:hypothetical protein
MGGDRDGNPRRSIRLRNPYVDPMSFVQVMTLRRLRALGDDDPQRDAVADLVALRERDHGGAAEHGVVGGDSARTGLARSSNRIPCVTSCARRLVWTGRRASLTYFVSPDIVL